MNRESTFPKDSFVFYKSFYESIKLLPKKTQLDIYFAICEFSLYGNLPELPPKTMAYLKLIIPQIEANFRRRELGKRGGRPPKKENQGFENEKPMFSDDENHSFADEKPNANVNVNVNANVNENVNANANVNVNAAAAGTPTLEEIEAYATAEGIKVDCRRFYEYFSTPDEQGRTWMDTKGNPVGGNWRRKLRSWANLEQMQAQTKQARQAKDRNTLNNYKVEGKGVANLDDIVFDPDEL